MSKAPPEVPVVLETTFAVAANGEAGPSRLSDLINQYRCPMWVDEIRISAVNYSDFFSIFNRTRTRILFGRHPITNEFVPSNVLAPRWPGDGQIVIKLSKPLYITPQDLPVPTIRSEVSLTIQFSLIGRLAGDLPQRSKIWVPYITAFEGASTLAGATSAQQSNRVALANPFRGPLTVRSFIGYRTHEGTTTVTGGTINNASPINVRVSNHRGRPVVRDPTPFYDLFNLRDQAWNVNMVVPQTGYFVANVTVDASDSLLAQSFNISMFGYREEYVQWGT